jgi:hypothetical protein
MGVAPHAFAVDAHGRTKHWPPPPPPPPPFAQDHQRGIAIAGQSLQTYGNRAREGRRVIENHERKGPAPQQHIRSPGSLFRGLRTDHPEAPRPA